MAEASPGDVEQPAPRGGAELCDDPFLAAGAAPTPGAGGSAGGPGGAQAPEAAAAPSSSSSQQASSSSRSSSFTCLVLLVMIWQAIVLSKYATSFPGSIFTGEHKSMTKSCANLFWVTNWSLFLTVFMIFIDGALAVVGRVPEIEEAFPGCVGLVKIGEGVTFIMKFAIAVIGIWVVAFEVKTDEVDSCSDLYSCAWWCFVGLLLLPCCIWCVFMAGAAAGHAAAQDRREDAAAAAILTQAPSYGTSEQAGQPVQPQVVQPFSGQGHKLAADDTGEGAVEAVHEARA